MASLESLLVKAATRETPGVSLDASGADFALYAEHAREVSLSLFEGSESRNFPLNRNGNLWSIRIEGAKVGMRYGYRVKTTGESGDKETSSLLLDPYARGYSGNYKRESTEGASGLYGVLTEVKDFAWEDDASPRKPMADSVFYETHVKGATKLLFSVPAEDRGTYAGLASDAFIAHVKALGVTALDLLPVFEFIDEDRLIARGLRNYWGYNPVGFFAASRRYAKNPNCVADEFRSMVKKLHASGLEVILDVVYNHTAETDETGPTLSFRGIDNRVYYKIREDNPALYINDTGCGNTINAAHPATLALILDSLRFWVEEMHVDGFRFDLAATLTRESRFLEAVKSDPVLSQVKLIAEPWDIGPGGYRLGGFGAPWSEWNDRFRDDVRAFWLTKSVGIGALAQRLCASSEIFRASGRSPEASLHFITAHDGFTLADLVSFSEKHNEANGEGNRDGTNRNLSINCGVEGATSDVAIKERRRKLRRALLATLLLSQGVPMLLAGDEFAHSQGGNNNAYCQDNTTTWLDWDAKDTEDDTAVVSLLSQIRAKYPQLRSGKWLTGAATGGERDIVWLSSAGREMREEEWNSGANLLGMLLGRSNGVERLLLYFYRGEDAIEVTLPEGKWTKLLRTDEVSNTREEDFENTLSLKGPTVVVLKEKTRGFPRKSGVLLHVTSLPSPYGIGDFGESATEFLNWLKKAKQSLWQVLPLTVTGEGNSPYMGVSVFAGNELLIDLKELEHLGLLLKNELEERGEFPLERVDFPAVSSWRMKLLRRASCRFFSEDALPDSYYAFLKREKDWLEDYALFRAISTEQEAFGRLCWQEWPAGLRMREKGALDAASERLAKSVEFWRFAQWRFTEDLERLRREAHNAGVAIIGDMPIFVSPNSADVWAHPELFLLDEKGHPAAFSGVPPDYFSPTGQFWGNPLYDWKAHREEDYAWFKERFSRVAELYDVVRIDHFRGFEAFWSIPAESKTALEGHWEKGPGREVFDAARTAVPHLEFIAEDLGVITREVDLLRRELGFPGMRVFEFAFDGKPDNPHLPANVSENRVYYPGTHDNDTVLGWFESLDAETKKKVATFLGNPASVPEAVLEIVFASRARYAVTLAQDVLGLGTEARMNRPGDATGSWGWRMRKGALTEQSAMRMRYLSEKYQRNN